MHRHHIFLGTLLVALIIQSLLWKQAAILDNDLWLTDLQYLQQGDARFFQEITVYAYPAIPLLYLPLLIQAGFGISLQSALVGTLILLISLSVASVTVTCYVLRPQQPWWITAAAITTLSPLYTQSTLASAVVIPLITLTILLALYAYEHPTSLSRSFLWLLGVTIGIAALVRFDITVVIGTFLSLVLAPTFRWKTITVIGSAFFTFYLLNPFMWQSPLSHTFDLIVKIYHYGTLDISTISLASLTMYVPIASLSVLGAIILLSRKKVPTSLPRSFIVALLFLTCALGVVLGGAQGANIRYFFPLLLVWEVLLPLMLLDLIVTPKERPTRPKLPYSSSSLFAASLFVSVACLRLLSAI